jgi:hypothetical protein
MEVKLNFQCESCTHNEVCKYQADVQNKTKEFSETVKTGLSIGRWPECLQPSLACINYSTKNDIHIKGGIR